MEVEEKGNEMVCRILIVYKCTKCSAQCAEVYHGDAMI
jgi:hypothetical protein